MTPARILGPVAAAVAAMLVSAAGPVPPSEAEWDDYGAMATPLTGTPGDPANGRKVFVDRGLGNCIACHEVTSLVGADWPGDVGPMLDGAGSRWSEAELRGIVADAKKTFEGSMMPSFYKVEGFVRPGDGYTGDAAKEIEPLLAAQQIEDVVAFLVTLKDE